MFTYRATVGRVAPEDRKSIDSRGDVEQRVEDQQGDGDRVELDALTASRPAQATAKPKRTEYRFRSTRVLAAAHGDGR